MKPLLAKLHKYVALSVGVFVALMGLTGATLVFRSALNEQFHPERRIAGPPGAEPSYERVLATARAAVPSANSYEINVPADRMQAFNVNVDSPEERRMFIDPYSGKLITNTDETTFALDWVAQLHTHLLAGDEGKYVVACIGGVLLFLGISGAILWWPRKWSNAFKVRWNASRLGLSYDLHRVAGATFVCFFIVAAMTGITLVFSTPAARLVGTLAGNPPPAIPKPEPRAAGVSPLSIDHIVKVAEETLPGARTKRVIVPVRDGLVLVRMQFPQDNHPNGLNRVYIDPYTAAVRLVVPIATASPGLRMFEWLYPLHLGKLFGPAHQWFQVTLGLAPTFLLVTGLIVWQARRASRKRAQTAQGSTRG